MTAPSSYRPDIDGLRAIAILVVVFFHAGAGFSGGYVGVDVFFVISGYLITSLIMKDIRAEKFSMVEFWGRRARRIAPAMVVMVAATLVAGWFVLLPEDFRELGQSVFAQASLLANVYFWRESGYFAGPSELKPLLHTWSLAVEEQFYLLMPPLLVWLHRVRRSLFIAIILVVMLASLGWSAWSSVRYPDAAFFLLPSRAWELGLGSLLALLQGRPLVNQRFGEAIGLAGLAAILYSVFAFDAHTIFPGLAALLPCLGSAAVIAGNAAGTTRVRRLLSMKPMVFIGLISYSLYLWHWPILAYANYLHAGELPIDHRLALVLAAFLIAVISWRWVEMPFRRRQVCADQRAMFRLTGASLFGLAVAGAVAHATDGFRGRFPADVLRYVDARRDTNPRRHQTTNLPVGQLEISGFPRIGDLRDERPPRLLVIGDSHGDALLPLLEALARECRVPAIAALLPATIPLLDAYAAGGTAEKKIFLDNERRAVEATESLRDVLLVGRWTAYGDDVMNSELLIRSVDFFASRGIRVWILRQIPEPGANMPRALALARRHGGSGVDIGLTYRQFVEGRAHEGRVLGQLRPGSATILDPLQWFFADGEFSRVERDGRSLYADDDHLSTYGALQLRPLLLPVFEQYAEACGS